MVLTILLLFLTRLLPCRCASAMLQSLKLRAETMAGFALVVAAVLLPAHAQGQQRESRPGWPCTGTVDPSYVRTAEATGGAVLLFQPTEVAGAGAEMSASSRHQETVFRAGEPLAEGAYEFAVPLDSTIESAYFFVSLQCLHVVSVVRPSGDELSADAAGVEHHRFEAIRLFIVQRPTPGLWKVRVAGRGLFSLIVKARTDLRLTGVTFVEGGVPLKRAPTPGKPQLLKVSMSGTASPIGFQFISSSGATIQALALNLDEEIDIRRTYTGEVTPPSAEFRLAMTGMDANGFRFQRVQTQLFLAER